MSLDAEKGATSKLLREKSKLQIAPNEPTFAFDCGLSFSRKGFPLALKVASFGFKKNGGGNFGISYSGSLTYTPEMWKGEKNAFSFAVAVSTGVGGPSPGKQRRLGLSVTAYWKPGKNCA